MAWVNIESPNGLIRSQGECDYCGLSTGKIIVLEKSQSLAKSNIGNHDTAFECVAALRGYIDRTFLPDASKHEVMEAFKKKDKGIDD